jgi:LPXTG-motif cell wall-anchored protein
VGEPQPLASIFVKKLTELVAKGLLDEEVKDLQKLLPMTEEQLRALVATAESKGKKGAAEIRAAFEQSIIELAAFKADEAKRKNMLIAGGVAVAAVAAFFFMRRKKS